MTWPETINKFLPSFNTGVKISVSLVSLVLVILSCITFIYLFYSVEQDTYRDLAIANNIMTAVFCLVTMIGIWPIYSNDNDDRNTAHPQ